MNRQFSFFLSNLKATYLSVSIFLSYLITLATTCSMLLNTSGEAGYPGLVPDLS